LLCKRAGSSAESDFEFTDWCFARLPMWRDGVRHILTRAMKLGPLTGESLYLVRCALADAHPRSGGTSDVASDRGAVDLRPFPYEPPVATKPCRYEHTRAEFALVE
jgi:hypothetical protein